VKFAKRGIRAILSISSSITFPKGISRSSNLSAMRRSVRARLSRRQLRKQPRAFLGQSTGSPRVQPNGNRTKSAIRSDGEKHFPFRVRAPRPKRDIRVYIYFKQQFSPSSSLSLSLSLSLSRTADRNWLPATTGNRKNERSQSVPGKVQPPRCGQAARARGWFNERRL